MKPEVVAVLDVGKTNKKVLAFDSTFQLLHEERCNLPPIHQDGLAVEDTTGLLVWLKSALAAVASGHEVKAIAITTHGATVATLDADGELSHGVVDYANEVSEEAIADFFKVHGPEPDLHRETNTADFGFINVGKILHHLKEQRPEAWEQTERVLFYPQFLGYALTAEHGLESTYLGNHTYLWDFEAKSWSSVGQKLGLAQKMPQTLKSPWSELGTVTPQWSRDCGLPKDCKVTLGIHDSNASLLPILAKGHENFVLNSTGTWCVGMRPASSSLLSDEELLTRTFYQLDARGKPLKTSIFMGGLEYESFSKAIGGQDPQNLEDVVAIIEGLQAFITPGVVADGCIFPGSVPRYIQADASMKLGELQGVDPVRAYAALNLSLALQSHRMFELLGSQAGDTIFVEGGFHRNGVYMALLGALLPECKVVTTDLAEATAFGAAMTGWMMLEGIPLQDLGSRFEMNTTVHSNKAIAGLEEYHQQWLNHVLNKA